MKKEQLQRFGRYFRLNFAGLLFGFLFYCFALTPSLLPRPAMFEGIIAGICFSIGYGLGVLFSWAIRRVVRKEPSAKVKKASWRVMLVVVAAAAIIYSIQATGWQNEVRLLIGETEFAGQHVLTILLIAFLTAAILIAFARLLHRLIYLLSEFVERWLPRRVSFAIGTVLVILILVWFYNGVLLKTFISVSNNFYRSTNERSREGVTQPSSLYRSGSDNSLLSWDSIGYQGRSFVSSGPSIQDLEILNDEPASEPIRVYVGVKTPGTPEERAALAVQELERTGAFDRKVLVVMSATGTGWIEPQAADSLEYIWNGDSALVSMQYSYLPSWISFMVDHENAQQASRALFDAVYDKWHKLPASDRPKLLVHGLSLGAYGAQSVFSGVEDLQNRTDGGLFVGSPHASQPWKYFTENRDPGSPEWQPIFQSGEAVRFAAQSQDLQQNLELWESPRIIYVQHASDPVVWWNPDLIWHEPDWLMETRGPDVTRAMQWYPFVTFFQVSVDQFFATFVPPGHGHNYSDGLVASWTALATPEGWTSEKAATLQELISAYPVQHLD